MLNQSKHFKYIYIRYTFFNPVAPTPCSVSSFIPLMPILLRTMLSFEIYFPRAEICKYSKNENYYIFFHMEDTKSTVPCSSNASSEHIMKKCITKLSSDFNTHDIILLYIVVMMLRIKFNLNYIQIY